MIATETKLERIENALEIEKRFERANVTTVKQRLILTEIYKQPGIGTRELTQKTKIMRQTIVSVCDKLAISDLIEISHDPGLGRTAKVMRYSITKKGSDLVELVKESEPVALVEPVIEPEPEPKQVEPKHVIEPVKPVALREIDTDGLKIPPRSYALMLNVVLRRKALVSSFQQAAFLAILGSKKGATVGWVASVLGAPKRTIWNIITNLQMDGMVCPVNPANGARLAEFKATDEARTWLDDQMKGACHE